MFDGSEKCAYAHRVYVVHFERDCMAALLVTTMMVGALWR